MTITVALRRIRIVFAPSLLAFILVSCASFDFDPEGTAARKVLGELKRHAVAGEIAQLHVAAITYLGSIELGVRGEDLDQHGNLRCTITLSPEEKESLRAALQDTKIAKGVEINPYLLDARWSIAFMNGEGMTISLLYSTAANSGGLAEINLGSGPINFLAEKAKG